jgi:hypothetical protein
LGYQTENFPSVDICQFGRLYHYFREITGFGHSFANFFGGPRTFTTAMLYSGEEKGFGRKLLSPYSKKSKSAGRNVPAKS